MDDRLPALIPYPRRLRLTGGLWPVPRKGIVGLTDWTLANEAREVQSFLSGFAVGADASATAGHCEVTLVRRRLRHPQGYALTVRREGVVVAGSDAAAVFWGVQTLRQLVGQYGNRIPCLCVEDYPDFADRGVYYDVTRGRVPRIERLTELAELLARHKINQLQLYIEHTFRFRGHPAIGRNESPLTADDVLTLDAHCRRLHVELVPSLASFGHLATVLRHPRYRHLAEDWGVGRYLSPDAHTIPAWARRKGWSLAPANPGTYRFLDSLFAEFLPLFSSPRFNVCCDETMDLGMGQSYRLAQRKGRGSLYLDHVLRLRDLAAKYGKTILFWGDIIRHYPELIPRIPKDVTVLDWGYGSRHPFGRIADFRKAGVPFYACPGTSSWVSLFPRLHESEANIRGFAAAARKSGASGLLNTDWGDGGHHNFMEFSWYGYLLGAEEAWNGKADPRTYAARFCRTFLGTTDTDVVRAVRALGDIAHLNVAGRYQSVWHHLFFALPDSDLFAPGERRGATCRNGRIRENVPVRLDAALGRRTLTELQGIRRAFADLARQRGTDPHKVLPYWVFATDTIAHAARKLTVLGPGGENTPAARRALRSEMRALQIRFAALWMARNRRSEIRMTLRKYRKAIVALSK
jgi:hypothetical protein